MNQANLYIKANDLQKTDAEFVLENYARLIKWKKDGTDTILDVGCGTGDVTVDILFPYIPKKFQNVVATDLSNAMIDYAKSKYRKPNLEFKQLDITTEKLDLDYHEAFNHIFSFYCLHWVKDQESALYNMKRMLTPGGDMLLTFLAHHPLFNIYEQLQKNIKWSKYMQNLDNYISLLQHSEDPEKDYTTLLSRLGFNVHLCKVLNKTFVYGSTDILKKAMLAVNPFIKFIPDEIKEDYIEDYINEVRKMNLIELTANNNEGKVPCPYKLIVVLCSKPE